MLDGAVGNPVSRTASPASMKRTHSCALPPLVET